MTAAGARRRSVRLELPIESDTDLADLEAAVLSARASELSQIRRRGARHSFGYGSDSARETMTDEVAQAERRWEMLDRLLEAIRASRQAD